MDLRISGYAAPLRSFGARVVIDKEEPENKNGAQEGRLLTPEERNFLASNGSLTSAGVFLRTGGQSSIYAGISSPELSTFIIPIGASAAISGQKLVDKSYERLHKFQESDCV